MNEFAKALISTAPDKELESKMHLFGQFIGEWNFEWAWFGDGNKEDAEKVKGEWIFSWVLEGTAIQDVWVCPSREERTLRPYSYKEYGTTTRFYNQQNDEWTVVYGNPNSVTMLIPHCEGDKIILEAQHLSSHRMRWVFSEITENSFTWQNTRSDDDGVTWRVQGEMHVTRR